MGSPRIVSSALYGDGFHRVFKILAAAEIPADIICLPAHGFPFTDGRSEDIAIFVIFAAVKCFLYYVHFSNLLKFDLFCLSTEKKKTETKKPVKEEKPKQPVKPVEQPKEKTEAEKRAEAERAAAQAANKIAGAFGKGSQMGSKGNAGSGTGVQGSPDGNASEGKTSGVGGYGTFDLNGRSLGAGGLPVPVYNVQDEGRVVVTIVVNPAGQVISTSINKRTNTVNPTLRKAAEEAARKARFNKVDGVNNQSGTITYYFKLK